MDNLSNFFKNKFKLNSLTETKRKIKTNAVKINNIKTLFNNRPIHANMKNKYFSIISLSQAF